MSAAVSYESVDGPAVAVGPDGGTLVAWDRFDPSVTPSTLTIAAAWRDPGTASFSAPQMLSGAPAPPAGSRRPWRARDCSLPSRQCRAVR